MADNTARSTLMVQIDCGLHNNTSIIKISKDPGCSIAIC